MRIITDIKSAKASLLKRLPLELQEIPTGLKQKIREVFHEELTPQQVVERIVTEVRVRGDSAIFDYSRRLDGVESTDLQVKEEEIAQAYAKVSHELVSALNLAAQRIWAFHSKYRRQSWMDFSEGTLGQRVCPLERVGVYVPGGTACYPSTVLMAAIPAKVAGVPEVIVTVPSPGGAVSPAMLVASDIAQVDRVFKIGGAQAIAALAFGTQSIPKIDKICGPGNIFVQLAKKLVYGVVDIDGLYGPTELTIIADDTADPALCAADLLAQAEHDLLASAILITNSPELAREVKQEVEDKLSVLERRAITGFSLESRGGIIVVGDIEQAVELVNYYAPEHLSLMMRDAWACLDKIKNAGAVFIGEDSPQVIGDYAAGPSHVLPTGGTARFSSPLGVDDFLKITSVLAINRETLEKIGPAAVTMARAEGFDGHARAVEIRLSNDPEEHVE